jgi:hypothetical protein
MEPRFVQLSTGFLNLAHVQFVKELAHGTVEIRVAGQDKFHVEGDDAVILLRLLSPAPPIAVNRNPFEGKLVGGTLKDTDA